MFEELSADLTTIGVPSQRSAPLTRKRRTVQNGPHEHCPSCATFPWGLAYATACHERAYFAGARAYRSNSSRRAAWSVFSSRYLMMTGVYSDSPHSLPRPRCMARARDYHAPAGIFSG